MTFTAQIKEELSAIEIKNPEAALAECCGMILFANATTKDRIVAVDSALSVIACDPDLSRPEHSLLSYIVKAMHENTENTIN